MGWLKADILTVARRSHKHTRSLSSMLMLLQLTVKGWERAENGFLFHGGAINGGFVNGDSE